MTNLSDHHQYLFLGKVTGTLNALEASELDALFETNADIRTAYEAFAKRLPDQYVSNAFGHLNEAGYWKDIAGMYEKKRRIFSWRRFSVAAAVGALAIAGWYWFRPVQHEGIAQHPAVREQPVVQLKLSGGRMIDLSHTRGRINEGSTAVVNKDKTLSYSSGNTADYGINEVNVPVGMDYQVTLSDGSKIWMNATTRLFFPSNFHPDSREITLDGEAYMEIAPDAHRPFKVKLANSTVDVLGTSFNINTYEPGTTKVALVNGSIQFSGSQVSVAVKPGEQVLYHADGEISKQPFDPKFVLSWKKGLYYFEEARLTDIVKVIRRWFGSNCVIDNQALLNIRVAGVLHKDQPLVNFLDDLKAVAGVSTYTDGAGVLHFK